MTTYDTLLQAEEYRGFRIETHYDETPMDPREWDNLGTMVCSHRRYQLGDEQLNTEYYSSWEDVRQNYIFAKDECNARIALPLYLIDHSGLAMRAGRDFSDCDPGGWDSGMVGFIYVTAETIRKEYSTKRITKQVEEKVREVLQGEVETYSDWLEGQVYGYVILDPEGEHVDSCWGFYGSDGEKYMLDEARAHVDWTFTEAERKASLPWPENLAAQWQGPGDVDLAEVTA